MMQAFRYRVGMSRWGRGRVTQGRIAQASPVPRIQSGHPVVELLAGAAREIDQVVRASEHAATEIASLGRRKTLTAESGASSQAQELAADLAESLARRAAELRNDARKLSSILEKAGGRIEVLALEEAEDSQASKGSQPTAGRQDSDSEPAAAGSVIATADPAEQSHAQDDGSLRLLATQMAIAGSSREEIDAQLRSKYAVADTDPIIASVFAANGPVAS